MRENKGRWSVKFTCASAITTLILGFGGTATQGDALANDTSANDQTVTASVAGPSKAVARAGTRTTARWSKAINTTNRAAVNAAYLRAYAPKLTQVIDWVGGSLGRCVAGLSSLRTNSGTLSSLNFVRSLAGLAPVTFSPSMNVSAQKAALMMAANRTLSHNPSRGWRCYSATGARAAGKSNLALAYPSLKAGQIIDLYMDDPGSNNTAAGHRRWLLNPFATVMGTGSTKVSNALMVIGPTNASRPNPRWVGWPTAGYFPNRLEPDGRWSLSSGLKSVSFRNARVAVFQGSRKISVRRYAPHNGYAQPTLVWQMPKSFDKTAAYRVVVSGIKAAGTPGTLRQEYTVRLFTPSR